MSEESWTLETFRGRLAFELASFGALPAAQELASDIEAVTGARLKAYAADLSKGALTEPQLEILLRSEVALLKTQSWAAFAMSRGNKGWWNRHEVDWLKRAAAATIAGVIVELSGGPRL